MVAMHLARANMVIHEWDEAIKYAQVVIDNFPILQSEDQILQGFSNISLPDVVFGCDITADNSTTYMSFFSQMDTYGDGYAGIGVWRAAFKPLVDLSLIHISEPTRQAEISYAVFCLKKKNC